MEGLDDEQIRKERNFQVRNSHSIAVLFIVDVEVDNHQSDMSRSVPVRSLLKTKDRPAIWPENAAIESAI